MEPLGINAGMFITQILIAMLFLALPIISLIDLAKRKLTGIPLAIWVVFIAVVPLMGSIAYWIIRPSAEIKA
jgi:uncharacterized membrane protein YhaH (DUF805 family)